MRRLAGIALFLIAMVGGGHALAGEPPVHPREGHWDGHSGIHAGVHFKIEGDHVRHFRTAGVSFDSARIAHSKFTGRDLNIMVTGTFQDPRHVTGTIYYARYGRPPDRVGFKAHLRH